MTTFIGVFLLLVGLLTMWFFFPIQLRDARQVYQPWSIAGVLMFVCGGVAVLSGIMLLVG